MSSQKGNISRTRPQKHQNKTRYKNDMHDKRPQIKLLNSLEIDNVCTRCKDIIEWKIKYKKYKPLKTPSTCVHCHCKSVKHAYHILCSDCSKTLKVCPKCQQAKELVTSASGRSLGELLKSSKVHLAIKSMSERKRRTFYRHLNKPSCDFKTEEGILCKIKELTLGSVEEDSDGDFSDDVINSEYSENNEE